MNGRWMIDNKCILRTAMLIALNSNHSLENALFKIGIEISTKDKDAVAKLFTTLIALDIFHL